MGFDDQREPDRSHDRAVGGRRSSRAHRCTHDRAQPGRRRRGPSPWDVRPGGVAQAMSSPLLTVEGLRVALTAGDAIISALSLSVDHGAIVGIVGESGSGKTTLALACLGYARPGS